MSGSTGGRGLDHLMEQNATELGFLDAYGPRDEEPAQVLEEIARRLKRLNATVEASVVTAGGLRIVAESDGCHVSWSGSTLPLVPTDLVQPGMRDGRLSEARDEAHVVVFGWTNEVRRFFERAAEHEGSGSA
jgi:hypothetical protein